MRVMPQELATVCWQVAIILLQIVTFFLGLFLIEPNAECPTDI
jgi:hypothetical protein